MGRKTVALSLDENTYEDYKKYCEENSIILSRKVETFMKNELEQNNKGVKHGKSCSTDKSV